MIIFQQLRLVGKTERRTHFHFVVRPVLPVAPLCRRLAELHRRQALQIGHFFHVILNALLVAELRDRSLGAAFVGEYKCHARVDDRLPLDHIQVSRRGNIDVRKHLAVRFPANPGAGFAAGAGFLLQAAYVFTFLKIQMVMESIAVHIRRHPLGRILRGAQAQAVETQRILIVFRPRGILAAGIHLTEKQLPVIPVFGLVVIHGHSPAEILHFHGVILKFGDEDAVAVAFAGLVDGV